MFSFRAHCFTRSLNSAVTVVLFMNALVTDTGIIMRNSTFGRLPGNPKICFNIH